MKRFNHLLNLLFVFAATSATNAAVLTVTSTNNSVLPGRTNLSQAILALQDGDTIAFNIPGPSGQVH